MKPVCFLAGDMDAHIKIVHCEGGCLRKVVLLVAADLFLGLVILTLSFDDRVDLTLENRADVDAW